MTAASYIITAGNYAIVIWCNCKIYKFLKGQRCAIIKRQQYFDIQSQITRSLITQAIIPVVIVFIPLTSLFISMYMPITINSKLSAMASMTYGYIPMTNALSVLVFVKTYRKQAVMIIKTGIQRLRTKNFSKVQNSSLFVDRKM